MMLVSVMTTLAMTPIQTTRWNQSSAPAPGPSSIDWAEFGAIARCLESQQIGEKVFLLGRRERGAVDVAAIAVARWARVVTEALRNRLAGIATRRNEAAVLAVDEVETAHERGGPLGLRVEQIAQRRNRAIVHVRGAQPQPVERHVGVAVRLLEVRELILRAGEQLVDLTLAERIGVGIQPSRIGAEVGVGQHLAEVCAFELVAAVVAVAVTEGAIAHEDRLAASDRGRIGLVRAWRGRQIEQPFGDALDRRVIDGLHRHAGAERGRQVTLSQ